MIQTLLTNFKEGSIYYGLEICEIKGNEQYYLLELKRKNNELLISKAIELPSMDALPGIIKRNVPLFLIVNTSKVLTKQLLYSGTADLEALVNDAFPNLNLNHFYFEISQILNNPIVTISKKEYIDEIIVKLKEVQSQLVGFSLGISSLQNITSIIQTKSISLTNTEVNIENNAIVKISPNTDQIEIMYPINGIKISNLYLLTFSKIFEHLSSGLTQTNFRETDYTLKSRYINSRIFNISIKYALIFFLVVLLVNSIIFTHYYDNVQDLTFQVDNNMSKMEMLAKLESSVKSKHSRVEMLGASSSSKSTLYLDQLGKKIPSSILLEEIIYQPLIKPIRDSKPIELEDNSIIVVGVSHDDKEYSSWLEELEKKEWISRVETLEYDFFNKESSTFSIKISLNDN